MGTLFRTWALRAALLLSALALSACTNLRCIATLGC